MAKTKTEFQVWCADFLHEIAKHGIAKDAAKAHMEIEPELYTEWFQDGMLPNQAAVYASKILS
jgi:hypothetical protein